jgi:hypothetical protein
MPETTPGLTYNNDFFTGKSYNYNPTSYRGFGAYDPYSSSLGDSARGALQGMMGGQLSDSTMQLLNQQFGQNLASIREGAYGMPLGAQKGLEYQQAGQNALQAAQLAEQQRNFAIQNALPYEQFGANQKYLGYQTGLDESRYGQEWAQREQDKKDQYAQMGGGGFFNDLLGGASAMVGNFLGGIGGRAASGVSDAIFGNSAVNQMNALQGAGFDFGSMFGGGGGGYTPVPGGDWQGMQNTLNRKPNSQNGYMVQF